MNLECVLALTVNLLYFVDDSDYSVLEDPTPFGVRSILVIRSSQEKDFGTYNCSVTNPYGTHIMEIYLFKQSETFRLVLELSLTLPCTFCIWWWSSNNLTKCAAILQLLLMWESLLLQIVLFFEPMGQGKWGKQYFHCPNFNFLF